MKHLRHLFPAKTPTPPTTTTLSQPSQTHFISLIHSSKSTSQLKQIHAQILHFNLHSNSHIITQLISSSSLHNSFLYSLSIFNHFNSPKPNTYLFNALIRGFENNSQFQNSIYHFTLMLKSDVKPNELTFPFVIKSVTGLGKFCSLGRCVHCCVVKFGVEYDKFVRVCLVDMYVKVEELESALKVFDESPDKVKNGSVLLWNSVINGLCKRGDLEKSLELFESMPERNSGSWNCMINGFLRNGDLERAKCFFKLMPDKNVVSWTTMVAGLMQNEIHEEALSMFFRMVEEGVRPNDMTIVSVLSACAKIGALEGGVRVHDYVLCNGFRLNQAIGTALVDMYFKCGSIESACKVFGEIKGEKDLRTWSVMIWGWAIHGCFEQALHYFENMKSAGIHPDGVVFLAVITACSHSGRVDEGVHLFNKMKNDYSIEPTIKHYTLIVDLFGRAGRLDEALSFIERMPISPDFVIWGALFNACREHKNVNMTEFIAQRILQLKPKHHGNYVFLSNAYAGLGRWEDVERVRHLMLNCDVEKHPGWSSMEVEGKVHKFVAGDHSHEDAEEISLKLDEILQVQVC